MLLVVDAGNTNVVFAVYENDAQRGQWRISSDARRTADEYAVWLTQLMALEAIRPSDIKGVIIASVVPAGLHNLKRLAEKYFKTNALVIGEAGCDLGIRINIDRPEQVGADRLVNAVAAHARYGQSLIVVDFGTATSFDIIAADGSYEGGVIAPGINLSVEALFLAAAKLPRIAIRKPDRVIGKATISAMESGVFWGYVGLIEGIVKRIRGEVGAPMKVIATGGLAPLFEAETNCIDETDPDLTLRGLVQIFRRNRSGET